MKRSFSVLSAVVVLLLGLTLGVVLGQGVVDEEPGPQVRIMPLAVNIQQSVPLSVTLQVMLSPTETVTVTAPALVDLNLQLSLGDALNATVENVTLVGLARATSRAEVTDVIDGDTIEVMVGGVREKVRYIGVDTPEQGQPGYERATEVNEGLLEGQTVYLESDITNRDKYGRLLRYIWLADGRMVDEELVRAGVAVPVAYEPDTKYRDRFEQAATEAWKSGMGFWIGGRDAFSYAAVTTDTLSVREGPGTDFPVSSSVSEGAVLTVFGRTADSEWLQVRCPDRSGGWVSVEEVDLSVAAMQVPIGDIPQETRSGTSVSPSHSVGQAEGLILGELDYDGGVVQVESDENIEIINAGSTPVDLAGWQLRDDDENVFVFPSFLMEPGQSCKVYTDEIHPESCGFSFEHDQAIWGNSGDVVELVDPSGTVVDKGCWGKGCE